MAQELLARGHRVEVWTVDRGEALGIRTLDGVKVRYLPSPLPRSSPRGFLRWAVEIPVALRRWVQAYRSLRPDVLHVQCFGPNGIYAHLLSGLTRTPMVVSSHGETLADDHNVFERSVVLRTGLKRALRGSEVVTACAPGVAGDLRERFEAVKVTVVPNGVRLGRPTSRPPREERRAVIAAGRLEDNKGFDLLIRAVPLLPARTVLTIVGDGSRRQALVELARQLDVADRIHLVGARGPDEVMEAMEDADVVVVPSRKEAFGLVVLEAWAAGTPVVATSIAGPADFVTDRYDGLLVDPRDPRELAAGITQLLDDDALWRTLAEGGTRTVRSYSWEAVVDQYLRLYRGIGQVRPHTGA
ncbi:glycosyltransferase family 4 protein [Ornithinimicrobium kibberense]|uniref:glycosyltransferase family 4 protein n=1 Tax=Ornithinimicrobium kibberense TaxID=282060 RepID=UPI00361BD13B